MSVGAHGSCRRVSPLVLAAKNTVTASKNRITEKAAARRAGMPLPPPPVRHCNQLRNPSERLDGYRTPVTGRSRDQPFKRLGEAADDRVFHVIDRNASAGRSLERRDASIDDAARDDQAEMIEVGVHVEREAVARDPA